MNKCEKCDGPMGDLFTSSYCIAECSKRANLEAENLETVKYDFSSLTSKAGSWQWIKNVENSAVKIEVKDGETTILQAYQSVTYRTDGKTVVNSMMDITYWSDKLNEVDSDASLDEILALILQAYETGREEGYEQAKLDVCRDGL